VAVVVVLDVPANETRVVGIQAPLHNVAAMVDSIVVVSMAVHATTTTVAHLLSIPCAKSASSSATPRCWHRYDENYVTDSRHVAATVVNSYTVDRNWYTDTGATDHITRELEKLALREKYHDTE
jgi:hypothetical protein